MGRNAGFIAAGAALASQEANFVLIPEVRFPLEGPGGFLDALRKRIVARQHAVIVVAEGAGQHLFACESGECDASGNRKLQDIGVFLSDKIAASLQRRRHSRATSSTSIPATSSAACPPTPTTPCSATPWPGSAVHAAMAGKTDVLIGFWHGQFLHMPIALVASMTRRVTPTSELWLGVLESTGQPRWSGGEVSTSPSYNDASAAGGREKNSAGS